MYGSTIVSLAAAPVTPGESGRPVAGPGRGQGRHAGAGRGQQRVDVPVVAAGELDDLRTAGAAAGQPDRRHGRLGAGVDQAHLLDRRTGDDLLGERHLARRGRAEAGARGGRGLHRGDDLGVGVAQQQRTPRAHQVDVATAVGVVQPRAVAAHHEPRRAADGLERAHRGVHPAGHEGAGAVEQGLGGRRVARVRRVAGGVRIGHSPTHSVSAEPARGRSG